VWLCVLSVVDGYGCSETPVRNINAVRSLTPKHRNTQEHCRALKSIVEFASDLCVTKLCSLLQYTTHTCTLRLMEPSSSLCCIEPRAIFGTLESFLCFLASLFSCFSCSVLILALLSSGKEISLEGCGSITCSFQSKDVSTISICHLLQAICNCEYWCAAAHVRAASFALSICISLPPPPAPTAPQSPLTLSASLPTRPLLCLHTILY
jgi:hypothetical protein